MPSTFPVLDPVSPHARVVYDLFLEVLVISLIIFGIVAALIAIALWKGLRRGSQLPAQNFGDHRVEISWMIGPFLVVGWLSAVSAMLVITITAVPKARPPFDQSSELDVTVVGHQWWWEVRDAGNALLGANELHIPVGKKIRVSLESADVIHSFWVPQLAGKMDCVPGRVNHLWLEAERPGTYDGYCAEFCGSQHTWMKFKVYVHPADEYAQWVQTAAKPRPTATTPEQVAGEKLFFQFTCVNCHAIQGTAAKANFAPDLTQLAQRKLLAGGVIENSHDNLTRWLKDPQSIKPECKMPNFRLTDEQVRQLVAYLERSP